MTSILCDKLRDSARPIFLFGSTPPREGTSEEKARETCLKFVTRSAVLATDGFIVYDIQDEQGRTSLERPFPFRKTLDPSWYGSLFPALSGKDCIIYKCAVEESADHYQSWLNRAVNEHGHTAFNLVGAPTSSVAFKGLKLRDACSITTSVRVAHFGCVCIPERHMTKGTEVDNMIMKSEWGAEWFITQGIYDERNVIRMINEYGAKCRDLGRTPKKIILTFAPCGRDKTMTFIKWLGMSVPPETEAAILGAPNPVSTSISLLCDMLRNILSSTSGCGVPLGINVESLSIYKEEIDGAHELFQKLQAIFLNSRGSPWAVCWYEVSALPMVIGRTGSETALARLTGSATPPAAPAQPLSIDETNNEGVVDNEVI